MITPGHYVLSELIIHSASGMSPNLGSARGVLEFAADGTVQTVGESGSTINHTTNFLLTNRIPRRLLTQLVGWLSQIEQPLVRDLSIGLWRLFCDLDLSEAKRTHFKSLHDCFTRELKEGVRPLDPDPATLMLPPERPALSRRRLRTLGSAAGDADELGVILPRYRVAQGASPRALFRRRVARLRPSPVKGRLD